MSSVVLALGQLSAHILTIDPPELPQQLLRSFVEEPRQDEANLQQMNQALDTMAAEFQEADQAAAYTYKMYMIYKDPSAYAQSVGQQLEDCGSCAFPFPILF